MFGVVAAGLASFPVWGGFGAVPTLPRAAVELAPMVASQLQYEQYAVAAPAPRNSPVADGFESWAFEQHRAARTQLAQQPPAATCPLLSGFGNAPR